MKAERRLNSQKGPAKTHPQQGGPCEESLL